MAKPLLCEVVWNDAHSPGSTETVDLDHLEKIHHPYVITTVGWVLLDDCKGITIAGEDCGDGDYRNVTFIPRVLIISTRCLHRPRKSKTPIKDPCGVSFDGGITAEPLK